MINKLIVAFLNYSSETPRGDMFEEVQNFMIDDFENHIAKSENKKEFVEKEIKGIQGIISTAEISDAKEFRLSYSSNYFNSSVITPSNKKYNQSQRIQLGFGKAIAGYHKHLDKTYSDIITKDIKKEELTTIAKLLLLDYLGILPKLRRKANDTRLAEFLSQLTAKSKQEIRDGLGQLETIKLPTNTLQQNTLKTNLRSIKAYFDKLNQTTISKKVQSDIHKLDKQKTIK